MRGCDAGCPGCLPWSVTPEVRTHHSRGALGSGAMDLTWCGLMMALSPFPAALFLKVASPVGTFPPGLS